MQQKTIREIKPGEYFKRKPDSQKVYSRGEYCRESKRYICGDFDDISRSISLKGDSLVFVGFTF